MRRTTILFIRGGTRSIQRIRELAVDQFDGHIASEPVATDPWPDGSQLWEFTVPANGSATDLVREISVRQLDHQVVASVGENLEAVVEGRGYWEYDDSGRDPTTRSLIRSRRGPEWLRASWLRRDRTGLVVYGAKDADARLNYRRLDRRPRGDGSVGLVREFRYLPMRQVGRTDAGFSGYHGGMLALTASVVLPFVLPSSWFVIVALGILLGVGLGSSFREESGKSSRWGRFAAYALSFVAASIWVLFFVLVVRLFRAFAEAFGWQPYFGALVVAAVVGLVVWVVTSLARGLVYELRRSGVQNAVPWAVPIMVTLGVGAMAVLGFIASSAYVERLGIPSDVVVQQYSDYLVLGIVPLMVGSLVAVLLAGVSGWMGGMPYRWRGAGLALAAAVGLTTAASAAAFLPIASVPSEGDGGVLLGFGSFDPYCASVEIIRQGSLSSEPPIPIEGGSSVEGNWYVIDRVDGRYVLWRPGDGWRAVPIANAVVSPVEDGQKDCSKVQWGSHTDRL